VLLDVLTSGGPGGYWPELWGGDGKLYVVWPYRTFGRGMRVVDITDPSDIQWVIDLALPGDEPMYAQFQDEYAFIANHRIDMRTLTPVLTFDSANAVHTVPGNPYNPAGIGINTSEFALPLGNLLVTGGNGPNQGMAVWVHDAAPYTRGPEVGFHIPRAGQTNYPLDLPISLLIHETLETNTIVNGDTFVVRPVGGAALDGHLIFAFNDALTFTPFAPLLPETTYEVILAPGGITDAAGNPTDGYSFTFSTGNAVAVSGDGARVLVSRFISPLNWGEVWDVDAATLSLERTLRLPKLGGLAHQDNTAEGRGVPNYVAGVAISPDVRLGNVTLSGTTSAYVQGASVTAIDDGAPNLRSLAVAVAVEPPDDLWPLSDEFDDGATQSAWLRNYAVEGWGADKLEVWDIHSTRTGHMRVTPYSSTWFNDFAGALVFKEVTGDFIATIRLDVGRRDGALGRPVSEYSWAGLLVRAPRGISAAAPNPDPGPGTVLPWPPPGEGAPGHYTTEWQPGTENYIYLASGYATDAIDANRNVWQYEAKSTLNSVSNFYSSANGTGADQGVSTLQIVRRGQTFVLLRRHGDGPWIIETRYDLPAMPATLQVGVTAYTDWAYAGSQNEFHHNRTAAVGVGNPDIVADIDYFRLQRPQAALSESDLQGLPLTGPFGALQTLESSGLEDLLGDAASMPYVLPTPTPEPTATHTAVPSTPTPPATMIPTATATATATAPIDPGCPELPEVGCFAAERSKVHLREGEGRRRTFEWRWDGAGALADFGGPTNAGATLRICTYADATVVAAAEIPTGGVCGSRECWRSTGVSGYVFRDRAGTNDGVERVQLRERNGRARVVVKAKGQGVSNPLPINDAATVTVQILRGEGGPCWETVFVPPAKMNRVDRYRGQVR